ncbi:CMGC/CDK protein kinase [Cryptococcus deuterogattii 2001/935-1]|nr:CMGC/CDK protein kinase [Cryptococcus deuterogattii 2001/935-1]
MRFSSRDEEPEDGEVVEEDAVWKNPLATTKHLKGAPSVSSSQKASSYKKSRPSFIPSVDPTNDGEHRPRSPHHSRHYSSSHNRKVPYEDEERGSGLYHPLPKNPQTGQHPPSTAMREPDPRREDKYAEESRSPHRREGYYSSRKGEGRDYPPQLDRDRYGPARRVESGGDGGYGDRSRDRNQDRGGYRDRDDRRSYGRSSNSSTWGRPPREEYRDRRADELPRRPTGGRYREDSRERRPLDRDIDHRRSCSPVRIRSPGRSGDRPSTPVRDKERALSPNHGAKDVTSSRSHRSSPSHSSNHGDHNGEKGGGPIKLNRSRHRPSLPLKSVTTPPPRSPSAPPPPPPPDPPTAPPSPTEPPPPMPGHLSLEQTVPHAPNPRAQMATRPPSPKREEGEIRQETESVVFKFKLWTAEEELKALGKTFGGSSTLMRYNMGTKLGEGTFGVVTKAVENDTKRAVALKKITQHNFRDGAHITTLREIKILKSLQHPNVVPLLNMVISRHDNHSENTFIKNEVFMVFPYMDHDLCGLLSNNDFKVNHSGAKCIMKQLLDGMAYIHSNNIVHRDIKTANILVDKHGQIMIADFGLARPWTDNKKMPPHLATEYTNMVVTRWYRAPELLLGWCNYGPAVDIWSIGCVLGEMYLRKPILPGGGDREQLSMIFAKCGPLNEETWPGWQDLPGFPEAHGFAWDKTPRDTSILEESKSWHMDRGGADLLVKLLCLDPSKRPTASEALDHPWFWVSPKPAEAINLDFAASHEMSAWHKQPAAAPVQAPPQKAYHTQQAYQSQQAHHTQQVYQPQQPYVAYQSGYSNQQRGHGQGYQQQNANATRHNPAINPYAPSQVGSAQGYNQQPYIQAQGLSNMPPGADAYGGVNPYGAPVAYNNAPLPPSNMAFNGQSSFNGSGFPGGGGQPYSHPHQPYLPPGPPAIMHGSVNRPSRPPPPTNSEGRPLAAAPFPLAGGGGGGGMKTFAPPPPFSLAGAGGGGRGGMPPTMKRPPSDSRRDLGGDHKRQRTEAPLPYD